MQAHTLTCDLELTPALAGEEIGLAFQVHNTGDAPVELHYFVPFIGFDLEVMADDGPVSLVQPGYDTGVRPTTQTIPGGETAQVDTPIRLRFDPQVGPAGGAVPTVWSLRHVPAPIVVRATLKFRDMVVGPCESQFDPALSR